MFNNKFSCLSEKGNTMAAENRIDPVYKYVDKEVKALKTTTTKLRTRIENLEILGLQEQVISLDSKVKHLDSLLLGMEQEIAHLRISHDLLYTQWALWPMQDNANAKLCIQFARELAASALTEVRTSNDPIKIADVWYSKCQDYFLKHGNFEVLG